MKGRELLPIATALIPSANQKPREPLARSAVNRAYYAAFGEATDYAARIGYVVTPGLASHNRVWNYIGGHSDGSATRDATRRAIRSQGLFLKTRRQKADYKRDAKLGRSEPSDAVKEALRIIVTIDGL